jgi:hypothetical protein
VTVAALKRAVEGRDADALAAMYADDAVMLVIDHDNPPSNPRRLAGKAAISSYFSDVCGRDMAHLLETAIAATGSPSPKAAPIRTAPRCFARRCSISKAERSHSKQSFRPGTADPALSAKLRVSSVYLELTWNQGRYCRFTPVARRLLISFTTLQPRLTAWARNKAVVRSIVRRIPKNLLFNL